MNHQSTSEGPEISLATILNILWRRRVIVLALPLLGLILGILYGMFGTRRWSATVTIRPGITAFDPAGGPHRQWQLKDITRWYDLMMYRRELVERLGLPTGARPVIRTEFVAQGLQNLQGGDVITLWTTGTSPELAAAILDTSLVLFAEYAEQDSVSSQIKLTQEGLRLRIDRLRADFEMIEKRRQSLDLRLESARAESLLVIAEDLGFSLSIDRFKAMLAYYERRLADLREEEPRLVQDLDRLDFAMRQVAATDPPSGSSDAIPPHLKRDSMLDRGDVLESLSRAKLEVQQELARNRTRQDSLIYDAEIARVETTRLEIKRETTIRAKIQEAGRKIGDIILEREFDLPRDQRGIENEIAEHQVKLDLISPLQRVGKTEVSDRPVRPRTLRAMAILVFLGLVGGLALAFTWDYVAANRERIFRS